MPTKQQGVKNAYNYSKSALGSVLDCGKDLFYRVLTETSIDWRKILCSSTKRLWSKIQSEGSAGGDGIRCLMVDDTDFPKRGSHTEAIGKVFSHVEHRMVLGFKALFLAITDGKSQLLLDFAIVAKRGSKKSGRKYSRKLKCHYIVVNALLASTEVRLFLSRRGERSDWSLLLTTDTSLDFDSQIACTTITAMQYNILSTALRFSDYETIGGLFRDAVQQSTELSITDRIWDAILEIVYAMSVCFNLPDDEILDIIVNNSTPLDNVINIYTLKFAS